MLVELDGVEAYAEDGWQGRRLRLGETIVRLGQRVGRCVMTNVAPDTGANDFDTLKVWPSIGGPARSCSWASMGTGAARPDRRRRRRGDGRLIWLSDLQLVGPRDLRSLAFRQGESVLHDRDLDAVLVQERVQVAVVLALVQHGVHEDVGRAVPDQVAVDVHLARRRQLLVA
jgi:hypothetical protein